MLLFQTVVTFEQYDPTANYSQLWTVDTSRRLTIITLKAAFCSLYNSALLYLHAATHVFSKKTPLPQPTIMLLPR
jgi:hypothetical protein